MQKFIRQFINSLFYVLPWLIIILTPLYLHTIVPFKLCEEFEVQNCKNLIINTTIILGIVIYILIFLITSKYKRRYFYFFNFNDYMRHIFFSQNSSLRKMKKAGIDKVLIDKRDKEFLNILINLTCNFIFLISTSFIQGTINNTHFDYRIFISEVLKFNYIITFIFIIVTLIFLGYEFYVMKKKYKITFGLHECILGIVTGGVSIFSKILSILDGSSIIKSHEILLLIVIILGSLSLIISGLENIKKGLDYLEQENENWQDTYKDYI